MPRRKTRGLTDAEHRVMNVLWDKGEATVAQVQKALARHKLAYTSVLTVIRILEAKGYVTHRPEDRRAYVYMPAVSRSEVRRAALQRFLAAWFEASPDLLAANLLDETDLDSAALEQALRTRKRKGRR